MSRNLTHLVSAISKSRVLCVGDVMLDRFIDGEVTRISPEAPVPILRIINETEMLGGAGNVIRNVVALGGKGTLVAITGDDAAGDEIDLALASLNEANAELVRDKTRATTIKSRFIAGTQQILRSDSEVTTRLSDHTGEAILAKAKKVMSDHDVLVLSDYGKGVLNHRRAKILIEAAKSSGIPVVVDPKGVDYGIYSGADVITPNRKEIQEASGMLIESVDDAATAALEISKRHNLAAVLVTLSQNGMLLAMGTDTYHLRAVAREVFDVSGAGDTVVATIAGALAAGAKLQDAARLANICAGIVVAKTGTAAAYLAEVIISLNEQDISCSDIKIVDRDQAHERVEVWRRQNLKVGFTNGCFDLLHPGHMSIIKQARNACDRLIVGINTDASVTRLKGVTRPIQSETARATMLASLTSVDLCVPFDEDTPIDLITLLRPDVLVKGADYTGDEIAGASQVQSWGGQVIIVELEDGFSTTAIIDRIVKSGRKH